MDRKLIKIVLLFAVFYVLVYLIGQFTPLEDWGSPMFFLMPFPVFILMYYAIDWFNQFFETDLANTVFFPLAFVIVSFIAYFVVLWWYFGNISQLNNNVAIPYDFWEFLRHDAFVVFIFFGIAGWLTRLIVRRTDETKTN
ncbi:MAG: hypothetical protein Q7S21_07385 [archaeon]|nr:hypothetical protein [archaeon]